MPTVVDGELLAFTAQELIDAARSLYWQGVQDAKGPPESREHAATIRLNTPGYLKQIMIQAGLILAPSA